MASGSLRQLAYALSIVGGILMVVLGLVGLLGLAVRLPFGSSLPAILSHDIVGVVLGVVAIIGSKRVGDLIWAVVLIVVGYIGGGIGGLLVLIGGILGLLSRFIH